MPQVAEDQVYHLAYWTKNKINRKQRGGNVAGKSTNCR
jgi:hypothetical protein